MAKKWEVILTHKELLTLTPKEIKENPDRFEEFFEDLDNPTDEEVTAYFQSWLPEMSDPWEIPANGRMKLITTDGDKVTEGDWTGTGE